MGERLVPLTHIRQKPGLCGAATAQMILHSQGLAGISIDEQELIFGEVQANTSATRPTRNVRPHDCPGWDAQKCTTCAGEPEFTCWCTYPPALEATMVQRGLPVTQTVHQSDLEAAERVLDCIDLQVAPAVLVSNGTHWIAVSGYVTGTGPNDATLIGGRWVSSVAINDPNVATSSDVAIATWLEDYLSPIIQCGDFIGRHVVIGVTATPTIPAPAPAPAPDPPGCDEPSTVPTKPPRRHRPPKKGRRHVKR